MEFQFNNKSYPVEIIKKKTTKNTYLRVKPDLSVLVTTNIFTSDKEILKIIKENKKFYRKNVFSPVEEKEMNEGFFYLGKRYDVVYVQGNEVEFGENKVFIGKEVDLDKWFKKQAEVLFKEHLDFCYQNFTRKIPYPKLRIRKMSTRWGVCNYKTIVVTLNLNLIKWDLSCLDYVIYHELSHLVEANHSNKFWSVVEENYPDYKKVRSSMKYYD